MYPTADGYSTHKITLGGNICCNVDSFFSYCEERGYPSEHVRGKANSFTLPVGQHHGRGFVLLLEKDARNLLAYSPGFTLTLSFHDSYGQVNIQKLGIVRIQEVTGVVGRRADDALAMVELADVRYLGDYSTLNEAYNYRSYRYVTNGGAKKWLDSTTNGGTPWSWSEVVQKIWAELPGDFGGLTDSGAYPSSPPENLIFRGVSAWDALCSVLSISGNTIFRDLAGNFTIVAKNAAQTTGMETAVHRKAVYHTANDSGLTVRFPEKIRVYFPADYVAFQNDTDAESVAGQDAYRLTPLYSVDVKTTDVLPAASVVSGTKAFFHAPMSADFDYSGNLLNVAYLDQMAEELVTTWLGGLDYSSFSLHTVYHGFHPNLLPGGKTTAVCWHSLGNGSKTETLLSPLKYDPKDVVGTLGKTQALFLHSDEVRSPPDLARKHEHASRFAVVELLEDLECDDDSAEATILYGDPSGAAVDWLDAAKTIDVINATKVAYKEGDRLLVLWHWQSRLWLVVSPAPMQMYRSTLATMLCPGDEDVYLADYPMNINCCADTHDDLEARNPYKLAGRTGANVLLVWDCVENKLSVIQVEHEEEIFVRYPFIVSKGCEAEYVDGTPTGNTVPTGECKVKYKKRAIAVMSCDENEVEYTLISTTVVYAMTDLYQYGLQIWGTFTPFFAMCVCDPIDQLLLEGTDCSYGSGSGA